MKKLSPYSIGEPPTFDPCEKCLLKVCCSEICDARLRWFMNQVKTRPEATKIYLKKYRRKTK